VTGSATLNGAINATLINGFTPALGDSFMVVTAGSREGQFSSQNLPSLGGGLEFRVGYRPTSVVLTVVNPTAPTVAINSVSVAEGDSGTTNAVFTVTLSAPSSQTVTVDYATADGVAMSPGDYASTSGTVTFPPFDTSQQITVPVNGDLLDESDETFFVNLSNPTNTTISDGQGVGTIIDDDPTPTLSINDVTVTEGDSGTVNAAFTVSLSAPSGRTVTVDYITADGTAASPADYTAGHGTLTFPVGSTTQPVTVLVNGDVLDEADETFLVNLTAPTNATIADSQGVGTITDDDPPPSISINDVTVTEGNSGTVNATFTVTLSAASGKSVTVDYTTADDTALQPSDYTATSGTLAFPPGSTSQSVTVLVQGDLVTEANETFFVNLTNPVNATIADGQGTGTIANDDNVTSVLSINNLTVTEGDAGTTNAVFTATLTPSSGQTVTVDYATADGTAASPADYVSGSGTVTFTPGVTSQSVTVVVKGDLSYETNETFLVNLSNPVNATIGTGQGIGTITNDDSPPTISINDVSVAEGNSGTVNAVFTVSLSSASGVAATVNYATADNTALAPGDYTATSGTLTFPPGTTSQSVTVLVKGDVLDEPDETYFVNLTAPTSATISDNQGLGTITDDDTPPAISIHDVSVPEGNIGYVFANLQVTLSSASGRIVMVDFATADNTATSPDDYTSRSGTLTFPPGTKTQTITVSVIVDTVVESDETFFVNLTNPVNATIANAQGQATIVNDDAVTVIKVAPVKGEYWRQHPSLIARYLPIDLGHITVATSSQAELVLKFGDGLDWNNRLRAELLAALLNIANGSANAACVQPTVDDAQSFLDANGSKHLITRKYRELAADAHDLTLELRAYNGGYAPCFPGAATLAEQEAPEEGTSVLLEPNYPNPFNGYTTIEYGLPAAAHARLVVYDVHGREVKVLVDEDQDPGDYSATWNGTDGSSATVGSGVYYYRLTAGGSDQLGKMIFVK